jgi:hypothetical protein
MYSQPIECRYFLTCSCYLVNFHSSSRETQLETTLFLSEFLFCAPRACLESGLSEAAYLWVEWHRASLPFSSSFVFPDLMLLTMHMPYSFASPNSNDCGYGDWLWDEKHPAADRKLGPSQRGATPHVNIQDWIYYNKFQIAGYSSANDRSTVQVTWKRFICSFTHGHSESSNRFCRAHSTSQLQAYTRPSTLSVKHRDDILYETYRMAKSSQAKSSPQIGNERVKLCYLPGSFLVCQSWMRLSHPFLMRGSMFCAPHPSQLLSSGRRFRLEAFLKTTNSIASPY